MRKSFWGILIFVLLLCLTGCGNATPVITDINILDAGGTEIVPDELGTFRTEQCTVEVLFSGNVETISFYAVTEDENGKLDGDLLASGEAGKGIERALYDWELPLGFTGYIWVVLNENLDDFSEINSRAISSDLHFVPPYVVFSCEYNGSPLQVMLYQPIQKNDQGIWAVESYKYEGEIHPYVFVSDGFFATAEAKYIYEQNNVSLLGGDSYLNHPDEVALAYLLEEFDFVPESYELQNQKDNSYE